MNSVIRLCMVYALAAFWTAVQLFRMFMILLREGKALFHVKPRNTTPDCLMTNWEHHWISLSSVKLHYVQAGAREKPLMLMLHGFPEFWYTWRHLIPVFQNDYRVVAVDMRGYGSSDKPHGKDNYSMEKLVQDISELIPALGSSSCVLVAHDWGGVVGWQVVLKHPDLVDKLVMMNSPHPKAFNELLMGNPQQLLKSWYMFFFVTPCLPEWFLRMGDLHSLEQMLQRPPAGCKNPNAFSAEDMEAWKYTFSQPDAFTPPLNYYRSALTRREPVRSQDISHMVQPPTLIIWGTEDVALHRDLAHLSAKYCRDAKVELVEGASHWVQNDQPTTCARLVKEFLSQEN